MRYANFLQLIALFTLIALSAFEYRQAREQTEAELYRLRVQKSFSNRQSFAYEYGPDYKKIIKEQIEANKQLLLVHWTHLEYKIIAIILLALLSVYHFIRYFHIDYDLEHEHLPLERYDAWTWILNFAFFAIVSLWYAYFSKGYEGAILGYILGILCAIKSLWHISNIVQILEIKRLQTIRVAEILVATLIYFHLIGFVLFYYGMMLMKIPAIIEILNKR